MVHAFRRLGNKRIATRYCNMNPKVKEEDLLEVLNRGNKLFRWSGADLFNVTNEHGNRNMIIIETNSSPSGQKSMPLPSDAEGSENMDGYHKLMEHTFFSFLREREEAGDLPEGKLAILFDKNDMEAFGYAHAMADVSGEDVYVCKYSATDADPPVRWNDGIMSICLDREQDTWIPIRATFRYVTQQPWNRIPLSSKTMVVNPIVACLAGGRNKMAADKAYEFLNLELSHTGLQVRVPETIRDVSKEEVPLWVQSMGGKAVVKVPYSNAGQGVFTIINEEELDAFMALDNKYDKFIVQALVGHNSWSSSSLKGSYFHTGTIPDRKNQSFVADLRMMICSTPTGFMPLAVYARRAELPLIADISSSKDSWAMLGTNLSVKKEDGSWDTETNRLMLMDTKDFNNLGIGMDDLIDAYVQTVLASIAIDNLAVRLRPEGVFDFDLFKSLNADTALLDELVL